MPYLIFWQNPDDTKDLEKRRLKKITASKSQQINCNQDTAILGIKTEDQRETAPNNEVSLFKVNT